jgi:hypothetical protein
MSLYLFLFDKENKKGGNKDYRFEYRAVQIFTNSRRMKRVWRLKFLFVTIVNISFISIFLLSWQTGDDG